LVPYLLEGWSEVINIIYSVLNELSEIRSDINSILVDQNIFDSSSYCETILYKPSNNTYQNRAVLYAISYYFYKNCGQVDKLEFTEWLRVMRNLIFNTTDNSAEEFIRTIKSIKSLTEFSQDILNYLRSESCNITRFLGLQVEEEKTKARLLNIDDQWNHL